MTLLEPTVTAGYYQVKTADEQIGFVWKKNARIQPATVAPTPANGGVGSSLLPLVARGHSVDWWFVFKFNSASFPQCAAGAVRSCPFGGQVQSSWTTFSQQFVVATDRVILIPGSATEVNCVKEIFRLFTEESLMPAAIARELNRRAIPYRGISRTSWYHIAVNRILKNPKYAGCLVYGRKTQKLHTPAKSVPPDQWVTVPGAWEPLIDPERFTEAQNKFMDLTVHKSNDQLLDHLRDLLKKHGKLSDQVVTTGPGPSRAAYELRFGSLSEAFWLIGYEGLKPESLKARRESRSIRKELVQEIVQSSPEPITVIQANRQRKQRLLLPNGLLMVIYILRHVIKLGGARWLLSPRINERGYPGLIARLAPGNQEFLDFYLVKSVGYQTLRTLHADDAWLKTGIRLHSLADLLPAASAANMKAKEFPSSWAL